MLQDWARLALLLLFFGLVFAVLLVLICVGVPVGVAGWRFIILVGEALVDAFEVDVVGVDTADVARTLVVRQLAF